MSLDKFFDTVNQDQDSYVAKLKEIVAIPSISCVAERRADTVRMGEWLIAELERLGASTKRVEPGTQELGGQTVDLPPVVLATYGADPSKKTVLIYGHYD
ncbi:hypothetical protein H4R35_005038, partial [Dimargaris xerosporica]